MVVLHLILRPRPAAGGDGRRDQALGQRVFDLYCTDMDRSLREMGIGDLGVPKRMKKMTEAFYGRAAVYRAAVAAGDRAALAEPRSSATSIAAPTARRDARGARRLCHWPRPARLRPARRQRRSFPRRMPFVAVAAGAVGRVRALPSSPIRSPSPSRRRSPWSIAATPAERAALAAAYDLVSVDGARRPRRRVTPARRGRSWSRAGSTPISSRPASSASCRCRSTSTRRSRSASCRAPRRRPMPAAEVVLDPDAPDPPESDRARTSTSGRWPRRLRARHRPLSPCARRDASGRGHATTMTRPRIRRLPRLRGSRARRTVSSEFAHSFKAKAFVWRPEACSLPALGGPGAGGASRPATHGPGQGLGMAADGHSFARCDGRRQGGGDGPARRRARACSASRSSSSACSARRPVVEPHPGALSGASRPPRSSSIARFPSAWTTSPARRSAGAAATPACGARSRR